MEAGESSRWGARITTTSSGDDASQQTGECHSNGSDSSDKGSSYGSSMANSSICCCCSGNSSTTTTPKPLNAGAAHRTKPPSPAAATNSPSCPSANSRSHSCRTAAGSREQPATTGATTSAGTLLHGFLLLGLGTSHELEGPSDSLSDIDPFDALDPAAPAAAPDAVADDAAAAATTVTAEGGDTWRVPLLLGSNGCSAVEGENSFVVSAPAAYVPTQEEQQQQQKALLLQQPEQQQEQQHDDEQQQHQDAQGVICRFVSWVSRLFERLGMLCLGILLKPLLLMCRLLLPGPQPGFSLKRFLLFLGPGWLVAMAYVDPGNLEADLRAGATRNGDGSSSKSGAEETAAGGYALLWLLLWGHAIGWTFQVLAARLGNVTNTDLARSAQTDSKRMSAIHLGCVWFPVSMPVCGLGGLPLRLSAS